MCSNKKRWHLPETSRQVHLPWKQCIINHDRHQHATSKGMDSRSYGSQTRLIKWNTFFQAAIVFILLYGCTTWTQTKRIEKKLDGNYTRMMCAILNMSWRHHQTKQQLYGHLTPIMKTIQVRWTRYVGHWWRSRDELISDILQWTPSHGLAKVGRPARTYIQQLCADTGCSPEDLPEAKDDREEWRERVRDIQANGATWWWWWWWWQYFYECATW